MIPSGDRSVIGRWRLGIAVWLVGGLAAVTSAHAQPTPAQAPARKGLQQAEDFYHPDQVQLMHLDVKAEDLKKMNAALPRRIYVPATFRWGDLTIQNVGVRYKGNSSSNPNQQHKRSFLIKFNEFEKKQGFLGLERIALDNGIQFGSLFSEQLTTSVLRDLEIVASRCNFAKLFLNGTYHGVYTNVERIDETFLKNHFADDSGPLYKVDEGGPGANLGPIPEQMDPRLRDRKTFEPKSDSAHPDARDVYELIATINQTPAEEFADVMQQTIELDDFLKTMAVLLFSGAFDQLTGWGPHNYYLYLEPQSDRWHYVPWDLDVGFSDNAFGQVPVIDGWNAAWPIMGRPPSPLILRIVDNPQLLERYRRHADAILEKYYHPRVLLPKIDALYARIKDDLAEDPFPHRRVTNPEDRGYESIVESIKAFARRRYETARAQLNEPGARPTLARIRPPGQGQEPKPGRPSPDAPRGMKAIAITSKSVTLRWQDNAEGEAGHIVQRAEGTSGQEFHNLIGKPGGNSTTASDTSVIPGKTYRYRVYAIRPTPMGPAGTGVSETITVRVPEQ